MKRYTINADGTVTDSVTGLMWQQEDDNITKTWQQALDYCNALSLGGHTDWRLPTIHELVGIVDYTKRSSAINATAFPNTNASCYWSSTTYANDPSYTWNVNFNNGYVSHSYKAYSYYVRYVRDIG